MDLEKEETEGKKVFRTERRSDNTRVAGKVVAGKGDISSNCYSGEKCVSSEVSADLEIAVKEDLRFSDKRMALCERTQEEYVQELRGGIKGWN